MMKVTIESSIDAPRARKGACCPVMQAYPSITCLDQA